jgi:hypothetical protein
MDTDAVSKRLGSVTLKRYREQQGKISAALVSFNFHKIINFLKITFFSSYIFIDAVTTELDLKNHKKTTLKHII